MAVGVDAELEAVPTKIQSRKAEHLYDEVCVMKHGRYHGVMAISRLLDAITEKSIKLAMGANPLSGLPGNESIQREIERRIALGLSFDVICIDIDNFKPYNDHYGFAEGDRVIGSLANTIRAITSRAQFSRDIFTGHIGGDDFIVITPAGISKDLAEQIVRSFELRLPEFHDIDDVAMGFYRSKSRLNQMENIRLLSLSIGIVHGRNTKVSSYAQIASLSSEVKKSAKIRSAQTGASAIVGDRRVE